MEVKNKKYITWFLDYFFVEREIATLKATIVMFICKPKEIVKCKDVEELRQHFEGVIETFSDERKFKIIFNKFYLSQELFEYARDLLIKKEESNTDKEPI